MYTIEYLTRNDTEKSEQFENLSEAFYFAVYLAYYGAFVTSISDGEGFTVIGFSDIWKIQHALLKAAAKAYAEE